jgi:hypothetical protein
LLYIVNVFHQYLANPSSYAAYYRPLTTKHQKIRPLASSRYDASSARTRLDPKNVGL